MIDLTERHLRIPASVARAFARRRGVDDNTLEEWEAICSLELVKAARTYDPSFGTLPETHLIGRTRYRLLQYIWQQKKHQGREQPFSHTDPATSLAPCSEAIDLYHAVLSILNARERQAAIHCYRDELAHKDAARRMGIKPAALNHLLTSARKKVIRASKALLGEAIAPQKRNELADEALFVRLYQSNCPTRELARRFRVDISTIGKWQARLGLPPRPKGRPRKDCNDSLR